MRGQGRGETGSSHLRVGPADLLHPLTDRNPYRPPPDAAARNATAFRFGNRSRPGTAAPNGAPSALSPSSTTSGYIAAPRPDSVRQVAWPDTPGGGGGSIVSGAFPAVPGMSRAGSMAASVLSSA
jgi:hypothetical protein